MLPLAQQASAYSEIWPVMAATESTAQNRVLSEVWLVEIMRILLGSFQDGLMMLLCQSTKERDGQRWFRLQWPAPGRSGPGRVVADRSSEVQAEISDALADLVKHVAVTAVEFLDGGHLESLFVQLVSGDVVQVSASVVSDLQVGQLCAAWASLLFENQGDFVVGVVVDNLGTGHSTKNVDALAVGELVNGGGVGLVHGVTLSTPSSCIDGAAMSTGHK